MKPRSVNMNADCLDAMRSLPPDSVDAIVTDPPYGLAFMGANWDYGVPGEMFWREALRVAKPGAYLLAFGGTRTYHRLACAIEDAGWECRDCIMWVYGSGFPKSMDVGKAIDKAMGAERKSRNGEGTHEGNIDFGMKNRCPKCGKPYFSGNPCACPREDSIPVTPEAAAWSGWGTAIKPACEPIVIARKPIEGTVAANVLKYGTGAINIDGCRVPTEGESVSNHSRSAEAAISKGKYGDGAAQETHQTEGQKLGRFPANLIHDGSDEVLALFPDSNGSGHARTLHRSAKPKQEGWGMNKQSADTAELRDAGTGSAARFFYCAKASRSERGEGNDHCTVKPIALMRYLVRLVTRKGGIVLDPFMGSGTTGIAAIQEGMNFIGIEKDPHYYEIAQRRISQAEPTATEPPRSAAPIARHASRRVQTPNPGETPQNARCADASSMCASRMAAHGSAPNVAPYHLK